MAPNEVTEVAIAIHLLQSVDDDGQGGHFLNFADKVNRMKGQLQQMTTEEQSGVGGTAMHHQMEQ